MAQGITPPLTPALQVLGVTAYGTTTSATSIPPAVAILPTGTILRGTILNRNPQGQFVLRTEKGDLALKTEIFFRRGMELMLRMEKTHNETFARIITVDGKSLAKYVESMSHQLPEEDIIAPNAFARTQPLPPPSAAQDPAQKLPAQPLPPPAAGTPISTRMSAIILNATLLPENTADLPPATQQLLKQAVPGTQLAIRVMQLIVPPAPATIPALPGAPPMPPVAAPPIPQSATSIPDLPPTPLPVNMSAPPPLTQQPQSLPSTTQPTTSLPTIPPLPASIALPATTAATTTVIVAEATPASAPSITPAMPTSPAVTSITPVAALPTSSPSTAPAPTQPLSAITAPPVPPQSPPATPSAVAPSPYPTPDITIATTASSLANASAPAASPGAPPTPPLTSTPPAISPAVTPQASTALSLAPVTQPPMPPATGATVPAQLPPTTPPMVNSSTPHTFSQLPSTVPSATTPSSPPSPTPAPVYTATVLEGSVATGYTLHSPEVGTLRLLSHTPLPQGAQVQFEVEYFQTPSLTGTDAATKGIPAKGLQSLQEVADLPLPAAALPTSLEAPPPFNPHVLPRPGKELTTELVFLMSAIKGGDMRKWMGEEHFKRLQEHNAELLRQIGTEFSAMRRVVGDEAEPLRWTLYQLPLYTGAGIVEPLRFYHREQENGGKQEQEKQADGGQHFIVDIQFTRLGRLQLDGFIKRAHGAKQRFDLIIRSENVLDEPLKQGVREIFHHAGEISGFEGGISFLEGREALFTLPSAAYGTSAGNGGQSIVV